MIDSRTQVVVIPMRDHAELTVALVDSLTLDGEADRIIVYDNDSVEVATARSLTSIARWDTVEVRQVFGNGVIYPTWNAVWSEMLDDYQPGSVDLHFFNNDIGVPRGIVGHLSRGLRSPVLPERHQGREDDVWIAYPDYDRRVSSGVAAAIPPKVTPQAGTWRKGGMSGFCFTVKPEKRLEGWPPIDERFRWYSGDGDLCQQMMLAGATAVRVEGLPLDYAVRTTSHDARNRVWVGRLGAADTALARRKYRDGGGFSTWRTVWGDNP